ncbi:aldo/keto reductase [Nostoc sp.]|uniref:aldo/keto reductase n=1 Tax=Nostoc sp. TaxID=1180 RepID=UPI002FEF52D9
MNCCLIFKIIHNFTTFLINSALLSHFAWLSLNSRKAIAAEKGATPSQLALAWLLAQGEDIIPIPGTKQRKYLEENVAATEVQLTTDDLNRIEVVAPKGVAAGERYPADIRSLQEALTNSRRSQPN